MYVTGVRAANSLCFIMIYELFSLIHLGNCNKYKKTPTGDVDNLIRYKSSYNVISLKYFEVILVGKQKDLSLHFMILELNHVKSLNLAIKKNWIF